MRTYGNSLADAQAETGPLVLLDAKNADSYLDVAYVDNRLDGGAPGSAVVPVGSNARLVLDYRPVPSTLSITLDGLPAPLVNYPALPGSAGQVSVDWISGVLRFHSSDDTKLVVATYKHYGTVVDAHAFNRLQKAVSVGGPVYSVNGKTGTVVLNPSDTGAQPLDSDLTALAAMSTTGLVTRTADGVMAARTLTGTTNLITITNGNGVSGNPTVTVGANVARRDQANTFTGLQTFSQVFLGGIATAHVEVTGNLTITTAGYSYGCNVAANITLTLPLSSSVAVGTTFEIYNLQPNGTNTTTIAAAGADLLVWDTNVLSSFPFPRSKTGAVLIKKYFAGAWAVIRNYA